MNVTLIQATPEPLETIMKIGSICYDSHPKDAPEFVKKIYEAGHLSLCEHIYFTFKIEGISRACSHQLVRHRHCSFTQRSQRYCAEDGFGFVTPKTISDDKNEIEQYKYESTMENIAGAYGTLKIFDVPNEDARYILPNACETSLYLSCNLRELIHIANERLCTRAQWEIRQLVQKMVELVPEELRFMLVPKCRSGWIICNSPCRKTGREENHD